MLSLRLLLLSSAFLIQGCLNPLGKSDTISVVGGESDVPDNTNQVSLSPSSLTLFAGEPYTFVATGTGIAPAPALRRSGNG